MNKFFTGLLVALLMLAPRAAMAQVNAPIPISKPSLLAVAQTVKATSGILQWATCYNPNAALAYMQVYDNAAPTVGTTAANEVLSFPATSTTTYPVSAQFVNAISIAATTTPGGSTALGGVIVCSFGIN